MNKKKCRLEKAGYGCVGYANHVVCRYEKAVRKWDIDGLKLDFIGRFALLDGVVDPAVAEDFAGRDIKSIPLAVDAMLSDVVRRLKAVKPDILVEFRQSYVGPGIRRFGNMLRATDCPLSMVENRTRIARLRLTSGMTAVHSDMLNSLRDCPYWRKATENWINAAFCYGLRSEILTLNHGMLARWEHTRKSGIRVIVAC